LTFEICIIIAKINVEKKIYLEKKYFEKNFWFSQADRKSISKMSSKIFGFSN